MSFKIGDRVIGFDTIRTSGKEFVISVIEPNYDSVDGFIYFDDTDDCGFLAQELEFETAPCLDTQLADIHDMLKKLCTHLGIK